MEASGAVCRLAPERCEAIVFLDFDGVTHAEQCRPDELFCRLPAIEAVLRRYPAVGVVISSSWRRTHGLEQLAARFSADTAARILGRTPWLHDEPPFAREAECREWLRFHAYPDTEWIALDDQAWLFRPGCPNLIAVPSPGPGIGPAELSVLNDRLRQITQADR